MLKKYSAGFMRLALAEAAKNLKNPAGGPFGACIVKEGRVLAVARNTVLRSNDPTAHAEINAIRAASRKLKSWDLSGCVIYSTTEPCPMCFSAIHWSKIPLLIYGTSIADVSKRGFNELRIGNAKLKSIGKSPVRIVPAFMQKECRELLADWDRLEEKPVY